MDTDKNYAQEDARLLRKVSSRSYSYENHMINTKLDFEDKLGVFRSDNTIVRKITDESGNVGKEVEKLYRLKEELTQILLGTWWESCLSYFDFAEKETDWTEVQLTWVADRKVRSFNIEILEFEFAELMSGRIIFDSATCKIILFDMCRDERQQGIWRQEDEAVGQAELVNYQLNVYSSCQDLFSLSLQGF